MNTKINFSLSRDEVNQFHKNGYLGPFRALPESEMDDIDTRIQREVFETTGPNPNASVQSRHMDCPLIYRIASSPEIIERIASLIGPDIILWATHFFDKEPGGKEIPWHQDGNYWPLEPMLNMSAWLAIDDVNQENSCVQVIPESHKKVFPHIRSIEGMAFRQMADPEAFDEAGKVDICLKRGEFFIFNEKLLHHSDANNSQRRRRGMTMRFTVPFVNIEQDGPPLHPGHRAIIVKGKDYMGFNKYCEPPA